MSVVMLCIACNPEPANVYPFFQRHFYYTNGSDHDIQITTWNTDLKNGSIVERTYNIKKEETLFQRCYTDGVKINEGLDSNVDYNFVGIPYTDSLIVRFGAEKITKTIIGNCKSDNKSYIYDFDNYTYSYEEPNMIYRYTFTEEDCEETLFCDNN